MPRCENYGKVGYPHIGYNVGGIVGRQSGYLCGCTNRGEVFGRKDVGGIAGQLEPSRSIEFDRDTVRQLADEIDIIGGLIDKLAEDAKSGGSAVNNKVQSLTWQMEQLRKFADDIDLGEVVFDFSHNTKNPHYNAVCGCNAGFHAAGMGIDFLNLM